MSEQELIQAGIAALKANNKQKATAILAQVVQQYPNSERGWFLLGMSVDDIQKRTYCFQRVLTLNPNNSDAKQQLTLLSPPKPAPPTPAFTTPPVPKPNPVFSEDEVQSFESFREAPPSQPRTQPPALKKNKQNNNVILIGAVCGGLCILAIAGIAGVMMFRGLTAQPAAQPPPQISTATMPALIGSPPIDGSVPMNATPLPTALPTLPYTPAYEEATCPFEVPLGANVTCGYVTVPENRTSNSGRMLRLAVTVFHSTSKNPAPDPVVFLQGGPGGQAVQLSADAFDSLVLPFLNERDYVTFDQRGTGLSEPTMKCDELDKVYHQDIYGNLATDSKELIYQNAFLSCSGLLQANGYDLSAYSTVESAADLRDIISMLGYEKVNLFGVSYGTRLAQVVMRNHPEIVHTAILDSVVPVDTNLIHEFPATVDSSLSQLFISCAIDPNCAKFYPDLESVFWSLVQELDANPVTLTTSSYPIGTVTETVDGTYLLHTTLGLLRSPSYIHTVPQTIYRVKNGDYSTLIAAQYSLPYAFEGMSPGLYISMMCREHVLVSSPERLRDVTNQVGVQEYVFRPFYSDFEDMYSACKTWGVDGPNFGESDAVISDIPSLILEGSFDPATPPFYGKRVSENLANSFYFEFPTMGHAVAGDDVCAQQIILDFLSNPVVEPDRSCLNNESKVEFLTPYTGEPPIKLQRESINDMSVSVPAEWLISPDGFFVRGASLFDITQISAFRANITVQELADFFSSSTTGYRGLDGAPVESGSRQANGYTWTLYYGTSNQQPVDIAIGNGGGSSLIIIMFSHSDEHEALFRTVFLPMIDSAR